MNNNNQKIVFGYRYDPNLHKCVRFHEVVMLTKQNHSSLQLQKNQNMESIKQDLMKLIKQNNQLKDQNALLKKQLQQMSKHCAHQIYCALTEKIKQQSQFIQQMTFKLKQSQSHFKIIEEKLAQKNYQNQVCFSKVQKLNEQIFSLKKQIELVNQEKRYKFDKFEASTKDFQITSPINKYNFKNQSKLKNQVQLRRNIYAVEQEQVRQYNNSDKKIDLIGLARLPQKKTKNQDTPQFNYKEKKVF